MTSKMQICTATAPIGAGSSAIETHHRLLRLEQFLRTLPPGLANEDATAIANCLATYRSVGCSLEEAFGRRLRPGERKPATRMAHQLRDEILRQTAESFFPEASKADQARQLHREIARYAASSWIRERQLDDCPARAGTLRAACWAIFKARDHVLSERAIRAVLAMNPAYSLPAESHPFASNNEGKIT